MINFGITKILRCVKRGRDGRKHYLTDRVIVCFGSDNIGMWFYLTDGAWASQGVLQRRDFLANWKALA